MDTFTYRVSVNTEHQLIRVDCAGMLELETASSMAVQARSLAIELACPIIYDFRLLCLPALVPLSIVATFPLLAGLPVGAHTLRSASIVAGDQIGHEVWESYRMASRRSGMHWNYFASEEEAMAWLAERNQWQGRQGKSELKLRC